MGFISHLPKGLINHLHSSSVLSNFPQAVEELICNSLDAGAKKISIYVDVASFYIKVEDDGSGITRDDLVLIGDRHATSKLHDLQDLENGVATLGFRGEALSSLSEVAIIELITRVRGSPNTYKKVIKGSRKLSMGICSEQRAPGTTVVVRELFYNLPVRRKNIESSSRKVLQGVKDHIIRLALIYPSVSFTAIDLERQGKLVQTNTCSSSLDSFCELFGEQYRSQLVKMHYRNKDLKLNGFISVVETSKLSIKALQFVYINGRFVHRTPIHKLINSFLSESVELQNPNEAWIEPSKQGFPAFLLDLSCPLSCYDITFEATKTSVEFKDWDYIIYFVKEALETVWSVSIDTSEGGIELKEEIGISTKSTTRKRKHWQHIDPTYYPSLNVDILKREENLKYRQRSLRSNKFDCDKRRDELIFNAPKQQMGHRKWKQYGVHEEYVHNTMNLAWSVQQCSNKKQLKPQKNIELFDHEPVDIMHDHHNFTSGLLEDALNQENGHDILCQNIDLESIWSLGERNSEVSSDLKLSKTQKNLELVDYQPLDIIHGNHNFTSGLLEDTLQRGNGHNIQCEDIDFERDWGLNNNCCKIPSDAIEDGVMSNQITSGMKDDLSHHYSPLKYFEVVASDMKNSFMHLDVYGSHSRIGELPLDSHSEIHLEPGGESREEANLDRDGKILEFVEMPLLIKRDFSPHRPRVRRRLYDVALNHSYTDDLFCHIKRQKISDFSITSITDEEWSPHFEIPLYETNLREDRLCRDLYEVQNNNKNGNLSLKSSNLADFNFDENIHNKAQMFLASSMVVHDNSPDKPYLASKAEDNNHKTLRRTLSGPPFFKRSIHVALTQNKSMEFRGNETLKDSKGNMCKGSILHDDEDEQPEKGVCNLVAKQKGDCILRYNDLKDNSVTDADDDFSLRSKWRDSEHYKSSSFDVDVSAAQIYKEWKNPCMRSNELHILDISSVFSGSSKMCLFPKSITKEELQNARVLQQIEKKFIAAVADKTLVVIDQHAADERVRLERLREEVLNKKQHLSSLLDYPKELTICVGDQQLLHIYQSHLEYWGWRFKIQSQKSKSSQVPDCDSNMHALIMAVPTILGETLTDTRYLTEYLHQLAATDGISAPPPVVLRIMASKACRGAIMFGDFLLRSECQQLVEGLKKTSLAFQCAHGRPTLVPIVNLQALSFQLTRLESTMMGQSDCKTPVHNKTRGAHLRKTWHGLEWHYPTLQRAMERLKHALEM